MGGTEEVDVSNDDVDYRVQVNFVFFDIFFIILNLIFVKLNEFWIKEIEKIGSKIEKRNLNIKFI